MTKTKSLTRATSFKHSKKQDQEDSRSSSSSSNDYIEENEDIANELSSSDTTKNQNTNNLNTTTTNCLANSKMMEVSENFAEQQHDQKPAAVMVTTESMTSSCSDNISSISDECAVENGGTETNKRSIGVCTDTQDLPECEPGTNILLEGIIWNETSKGVLILNVAWRGKNYVGSLIDTSKSSWAPPK